MRLSNSPGVTALEPIPNIWSVIERIEKTLKLKDTDLSEMLLLTDKELEVFRLKRKDLSAPKIFSLAARLNIGFERIVSGQIDYRALCQHYFGNKNYLPERYQKAALSRRRTTLFILNYIEKNYGWKERLSILHHFQLNEAVFANPDETINFHFASDLCEFLRKYKIGGNALSQIGVQSFLSSNIAPVKEALKDCGSVGEIYERMCTTLISKYFEKNFIYTIKRIGATSLTVAARPDPQLGEMLETNSLVGNVATAIVRQGIAASYPMILGLSAASVYQSACIYQGDSEIRYEIDFSKAKASLKWN